ncbi:MAG TPA: fluoride efflux transporter CrcB [Xanthomonadaceae bacterium]|nr:fluoride efflux transporter CrcB [Xanthomonadaceae bacterium]
MWKPVIAIALGAALGALLRWWFGLRLNSMLPQMPLGTLAANLVAAYVVGVGMAAFAGMPQLSPQWRLFIITGFCGGLSTFSTFSAEVVALLQRGEYGWGATVAGTHLAGSLVMTIAGFASVGWLRAH